MVAKAGKAVKVTNNRLLLLLLWQAVEHLFILVPQPVLEESVVGLEFRST